MTARLVLVTGASGFIGRHAAKAFAALGYRVAGISRAPMPEASAWGMEHFLQSEIAVPALKAAAQAFGEPHHIIHCAGSGSVPESIKNPHNDFCANVLTSASVLEFSRQQSRRAGVILLSSAAVYGNSPKQPLREDFASAPLSPYGEHKRMAEELAISHGARYGVPSLRLRLFSIYGVGLKKQLLWDACNKATNKNFFFSGTGEEHRDWLHVTDAARLLTLAVEHASSESPLVNGASGSSVSVSDMLNLLGRQFDPPLTPLFSQNRREADPLHLCADVSRIRAWGFHPQVSLEQGVAEYVAWFRSQNSEKGRL